MKKFFLFSLAFTLANFAFSENVATCKNPAGIVYRHNNGALDEEYTGWVADEVSNGKIYLVYSNGKIDILSTFHGRNNIPISLLHDGAKVIVLRSSPYDIAVLVHYEKHAATEIYSFFKEKNGKSKFSVLTSRTGTSASIPKSSLMVGECNDPIRFDLIY